MATFDDKSIFKKREEPQPDSKEVEEETEEESTDEEFSIELDEQLTDEEAPQDIDDDDASARVIGEELVESEKAKKLRQKKEKKQKKLEDKQYQLMVKNHRKAMKKNPENIKRYDTDAETGLPEEIVERRILDELTNKTKQGSSKSKLMIVITNIFTFFNMLILALAVWLMTIQAWSDLFFFVIASCNAIIGIYQELKAKKTIDRLSLLSAPSAIVIRGGQKQEINVGDVVLDDLILLETGNQICADSVVLSGSVEVNESLLTGESNAIIKKPGDLLFSGSFVVSGKCRARVDKVGKDKYIEKLSDQAKQYQKPNSELLKSLKNIIFAMAFLIIPIGLGLFFLQRYNGIDYDIAVRKSIGAMVGMIPSGLWLLTSVALFVGVIKLSQKNVLVQELYCIEMLARINVLCLDKTGTITDGTMSVKNVIDYNTLYGLSTKNIVSAMLNALNEGNLTSKALEEEFGLNKRMKYLATIPFSSQRKYNAVTFDKMGTFALGAPEFVLKSHYEQIKKEVNKYAGMGYRVLCLAHFNGIINEQKLPDTAPEIVSLILIEDNIRPDAINTINYFKQSGVSVRVISGDNPLTVSKISERAGIENADQYISLDGLSDAEVERAALKYTVFGRVSPSQKKLLVTTLKNAGKKVAMTGDGVNDILALREADCSIAIASGSEAARNVSHLVLLDSNFDSMPKVVAEGRRVINNVTGVASLFLTKTIFSLLLAIQALLNNGAYPISTNQLIMIDLFVTGIPSFVLALEPNNKEVEGNFLLNILRGALPGAITILIISLLIFGLSDGLALDTISIQTIIVVAATHTCLMVLFKVCKPFNTLRRTLCIACYSCFLIITLLLPQFLEFRPILGFSEYYSERIQQEVMTSVPKIEISEDYFYVFNGKVTIYQRTPQEQNNNISCYYDRQTDTYYYTINDTNIKEKIVTPTMSFLSSGNVILGGDEVYIKDNDSGDLVPITFKPNFESKFSVSADGYLEYDGDQVYKYISKTNSYYNYYNKYGENKPQEVAYRIMPTIELKNDQLIIQSVIATTVDTDSSSSSSKTYKTGITSANDLNPSIDVATHELLVNGQKVQATLEDGTLGSTYVVELPKFSFTSDGKVIVNGLDTNVSSKEFGIENMIVDGAIANTSNIKVLPYNGSQYYYLLGNEATAQEKNLQTAVRLSNSWVGPDVMVTESDHYIIDGYYTDFLRGSNTRFMPTVDSEYNLILGDVSPVKTDYRIPKNYITTTTGGFIQQLSLQAQVFLLMLCLLSVPLMKILQGIVPWIKRQVVFIQKLLSKF